MPARRTRVIAIAAAACLLAATACSTKSSDSDSGSGTPGSGTSGATSGAVKTGPGVTESGIKLGILTDISGPFAAIDKQQNLGVKLFWDAKNAEGGVCDRKITLETRDHHYDPQAAVTLYSDLASQVLALQITVGSPTTAAILPKLKADNMTAVSMGWSPSVLSTPQVIIPGTTYDIEMVNALDYLVEQKKLASNDAVGYIYLKGDYGEPGLAGATFAAKKHGITVTGAQIDPTVTDLTAQITSMKRAKVKALFLSATPTQLASVATLTQAQGMDIPIVAASPGFAPELLGTKAGAALQSRTYIVSSAAPFAAKGDGPAKVRDLFAKSGTDSKLASLWVDLGYGAAEIMAKGLEKACKSKDLTRDGLAKAFASGGDFDTDGVTVPVNFSTPGTSPSDKTIIMRPDAKADGGLTEVETGFTGADVPAYVDSK